MKIFLNFFKHSIALTLIGIAPIVLAIVIGDALSIYLNIDERNGESFYMIWFIIAIAPSIFLALMLGAEYWTRAFKQE